MAAYPWTPRVDDARLDRRHVAGAHLVAARVATTLLEKRVSLVALTALVFALQAVAMVVLVLWQHPAGVVISVVLLGMGCGAVPLVRPSTLIGPYGA